MKRLSGTQNGFTLLELLISTALLAIVLSALYSTFFLSHKAIVGLDESLIKLQECRNAVDMIGREAESLFRGQGYVAQSNYPLFKAEDRDIYGKQASRLTFTSFSPFSRGLSAMSYYVEEKDGIRTLYKKMDNPYRPPDKNNTTKGVELIEGLDSFAVEARDGEKWLKTWDTTEIGKLPDEIRITITALIRDRPVSLFGTFKPRIGKAL